MKHSLNVIIIVLSCFIFYSCNKQTNPQNDCYDIPVPTGTGFGYSVSASASNYRSPEFRSFDNDQILYSYDSINDKSASNGIYLSRLSNPGNKFKLALPDNTKYMALSWNRNGWILFWGLDWNLYKIKENGDSFTKIHAYTTNNVDGDLSPDGKKIIEVGANKTVPRVTLFLMNADGSGERPLDTTLLVAFNPKWSPDGKKIICSISNDLYLTDTLGNKKVFKNVLKGAAHWGISWFYDSKWLVFATQNGLFKLDTQTGQIIQLRTSCNSRIYQSPSVSGKDSKILFSRTDTKVTGKNTEYQETYIGIMNADGTNEQRLNLK